MPRRVGVARVGRMGIIFSEMLCRMEPQIFRCRFASWDEVLSVDFTQTPELLEKKAIEKVHHADLVV